MSDEPDSGSRSTLARQAPRALLLLALGALAQEAFGQSAPPTAARLVSKAGDWSIMAHAGPPRLCFATALPKESEPKGQDRPQALVYVSTWPNEGVKGEFSVKLGYPLRKGSDVTVTVGTATFRLFTSADRAWVSDATQELKLIEAMRKGSRLVIQGQPERGAATSDSYSLAGFAQAMQALAQGCP